MEALLTLKGIATVTVVEGSMTQALFLEWLENSVACSHNVILSLLIHSQQFPKCEAYPSPGLCVLIIDNAKIHHRAEILELFDHYGMLNIFSLCSTNISCNGRYTT